MFILIQSEQMFGFFVIFDYVIKLYFDMRIETEIELDYSDVLIKPRRSTIASRKDADITREYNFRWSGRTVKGTGIMQANMGTIGNFAVSRKMLDAGLFACLHKHHNVEDLVEFYRTLVDDKDTYLRCLLAVGLKDNGVEKVREIKRQLGVTVSVRLDVPNGYIPQIKQLVVDLRAEFPDMIIFVGNVVTGDITEDLILSGADVAVCGIGGGSACSTRKQTGVGRPQLSAVIECADAAHQVGGMVCADGGITCPGDIGKAFGAGGDFVMIGGLYAGTDEAEGEIVVKYYKTGEVTAEHDPVYTCKKFKEFYGMSSTLAQEKFGNGKPSYRASEGRVALVPYVGSVDDVNEEFLGGLRSTMTYLGAKRLKDIPKCCVFYRVNHQLNTIYESTTIGK